MSESALHQSQSSLYVGDARFSVGLRGALIRDEVFHLSEIASEWEAIVQHGPSAEPFFQPYWMLAFARSFESGKPLAVVTVRQGSALKGVLPLIEKRTFFGGLPGRTLRSLSGVHSCRFDMSYADGWKREVAAVAWDAIREDDSWDVVEALNVPEHGGFEALMENAARDGFLIGKWRTHLSPFMTIPTDGSDVFAGCPERYKSVRSRLKNYLKKLEREGEVRFAVVSDFDEDLFSQFLNLEVSGWKGKDGGAIACNPTVVRFYENALRDAASRGHLRLHSLTVSGKPVAMEIGLQMNRRVYSPKVAYDEAFSKCSPGAVQAQLALKRIAEEGGEMYDFLGPRARHKSIWTDAVRPHAHCYIFRPNVGGTARYLATMRLAPKLRELKHSRYGDPQAI